MNNFKKILFGMMALLVVFTASLAVKDAHATVSKEVIRGQGGTLSWNGKEDETCDCPNNGDGCYIKIVISTVVMTDNGSYWTLTGTVASRVATVATGGGPVNHSLPVPYYVFENDTQMQILPTDFPGIPPMTINLGGTSVNSYGSFTKNIPK
jgi:hypothetical protein